MHCLLHNPGNAPLALDKDQYLLGNTPDCAVVLPLQTDLPITWKIARRAEALWLSPVLNNPAVPVCVNGRRIHQLALLQAGDDVQFPGLNLRISSAEAPSLTKSATSQALNFADRVLVRVCTGREAGKAYALVNSLCIGRSALSEICIDDPALAERHVLIQRQGNDIRVKNLSPVLEMRAQGWVCTEAVLIPGAFFTLEQHRFQLQAPWLHSNETELVSPALANAQPGLAPAAPGMHSAPLFSRTQWLLLVVALVISGFFILLLML